MMWWLCCSVIDFIEFSCCWLPFLFPNGRTFHMQSLNPIMCLLKHSNHKWRAICQKRALGQIRKLKSSFLSLFSASWVVFSSFCICIHICAYVMQMKQYSCYKWSIQWTHDSFVLCLLVNIPLLETVPTFLVFKKLQRNIFPP